MTFSQRVKNEILRSVRNAKGCCAAAFLTAVLKSAGSLMLESAGYCFDVESDNTEYLTLLGKLASERLHIASDIRGVPSARGAELYSCRFEGALGERLGLMTRDADGALGFADAASLIPAEACCRRAFLQGIFVACGSVVIPQTEEVADSAGNAKYHLELRFADADFAQAVCESFSAVELHRTVRKNRVVLYLKESERIADLLVYLNAPSAKLYLENVIIARSVRNGVNRQNNCEVANIEKTVAASSRQLRAIALLREQGRFDSLPQGLREIALLREADPEATLEEIADRLHISKSGANHRFYKLMEIANQQRTKQ